MTRSRAIVLSLFAIAIAATCVRLGVWQLDRLAERRAENTGLAERLAAATIDIAAIPTDSARVRGQRVSLRGTYDFAHDLVLVNRSREGAPGINLLTPLKLDGRDTAVIVNRGWVYSPDGATVDPSLWREPDTARGSAYVSWLIDARTPPGAVAPATSRRVSRLDRSVIAAALPYPIAPYQLIVVPDSFGIPAYGFAAEAERDSTVPVRLPLPALDEGPHKSYAIQWFSFAAIALFGTGAVLAMERHRIVGAASVG